MSLFRVMIALILVMMAVLLAAGCMSTGDSSAQTGNTSGTGVLVRNTVTTLAQGSLQPDPASALTLYRQNLSPARKKIPEELLKLIDPGYPENGMTPAATRAFLISENQLVPADLAASRFGINSTNGRPVGDQVHLVLHISPRVPLHSIDAFITQGETYNEEFRVVVAWVDLYTLELLATLDNVKTLEMVVPPDHSSRDDQLQSPGLVPTTELRTHIDILQYPQTQQTYGNEFYFENVTGFLSRWNDKMHWGYSTGQIEQFNRSLRNGLLKKYRVDSQLRSYDILDMKTFCLEVGDAIGLTKNQSEQFATAADDDLMQDKMDFLARSEYNTTGPGGPGGRGL